MKGEKAMSRKDEARELEAKAKALRRAEVDFWKEVSERREEVLLYLQKPSAVDTEARVNF